MVVHIFYSVILQLEVIYCSGFFLCKYGKSMTCNMLYCYMSDCCQHRLPVPMTVIKRPPGRKQEYRILFVHCYFIIVIKYLYYTFNTSMRFFLLNSYFSDFLSTKRKWTRSDAAAWQILQTTDNAWVKTLQKCSITQRFRTDL